jgi:acetolactate synthase I/II/III large subunit
VHTAFQDSTPMIVFIGQVGSDFVEREAFQEVDFRRMFGQMSKWVARSTAPIAFPSSCRTRSTSPPGRPGPVVLALPEDMLAQTAHAVPDALSLATCGRAPPHASSHRDYRRDAVTRRSGRWF